MSDWYNRSGKPPWDIGRHQSVIDKWMVEDEFKGDILEIGCGTGENILKVAEEGYSVWGIDLSEIAINEAKKKSKERSIANKVQFKVKDVMDLLDWDKKFDVIIDIGLLHNFELELKQKIVDIIYQKLNENGYYLILGFNEHEPMGIGPPNRIRKNEIRELFSNGWKLEYIEPTYFESNLTPGKHNAWGIKVVKASNSK